MPACTAPRTWVDNELVTAALLNQHLRDNMDYLKGVAPPITAVNESSDYTTTSTSFVNVHDVNGKLRHDLTTVGGLVLIGFSGVLYCATGRVFLDVDIDGARLAGDDGLTFSGSNSYGWCSFVVPKVLTPGPHIFKLQWKVSAGTGTLYAGAGTSLADIHPAFLGKGFAVMNIITVERSTINIEALDASLRAALGANVAGLSTGPYGVQVHLSDSATPAQVNQARTIVEGHNPAVLTAQQQAEAQRQQQLETARTANTTPLNTGDYSGQNALIQKLAQKISWLEQEVANLRG